MANIKSQIKRNRQNEKARLRNKSVKSSLKTVIRKLNEASDAGNAETATALLREASRKLDKAVSKGVIHKNHDPARQAALYGQKDHVRIYSKTDYIQRLQQAGFYVRILTPKDLIAFHIYAIQENESVFLCSKQPL